MPATVEQDLIVSNEELTRLLKLDDEALFQEVKIDLRLVLMQNIIALPLMIFPRARNSVIFYTDLILSDEVEAPSKIKYRLIRIKSKLEEWLCEDLGYCSAKERVTKLIAGLNEATEAVLPEEVLEEIKKELKEIHRYLMGALFLKVPVSLLVYLLKKGLDLLCKC